MSALAAPTASAAITLSTADGNGADVTLSNDANQSQGTNLNGTTMNIRHVANTRLKMAYFRFDLSGVTGDLSGATITLTQNTGNRARTLNVFGVVDGASSGLGENWDESLITYSTAAGIDVAGSGVNDGTFAFNADMTGVLTTIAAVDNRTTGVQSIVSAASTDMDNFLATDTNGLVTFAALISAADGNADYFFATKEGAGGAQLFLPNAVAVPEPSSLALLGLAGVGLARRRRR